MNVKKEFERLMGMQTEIALATCVEDQPNVRIVNFYFDKDARAVLFSTFADNDKVKEMESNSSVAFTTIPHQGNEHVKAKGHVRKSDRTVFDVAEQFIKKIPDYKDTVEQAGEYLVLFEVIFDTAIITLNLENSETYHFTD